ncbi:MAG: formimidoylglutamase [Thermoflavifilum sp.]|nr:formimidoylglutamase [Thermoflavifilum sp.]
MAADSFWEEILSPLDKFQLNDDQPYHELQIGGMVDAHEERLPNWEEADLLIVGVGEQRGEGITTISQAPFYVRRQLYRLYHWHPEIRIADMGNIRPGKTLADTYAAMRSLLADWLAEDKVVVILGGSHDLTYGQYQGYAVREQFIEATVIDAIIDLQEKDVLPADGFLMDLFISQPNFLKHYNHIGFQSYDVQPRMLETLDKLRFDCYRVGYAQENPEDIEPALRTSHMLSVDIKAIRHSDAPANRFTPNGFTGQEICLLCKYAGMSSQLSSIGIYGFRPEWDEHELTARQIAQMIWYFIEGLYLRRLDPPPEQKEAFWEYHVRFTDVETLFLRSKRTGRWWMQLPDQRFIACTAQDYQLACRNEIPERWLRAQERL